MSNDEREIARQQAGMVATHLGRDWTVDTAWEDGFAHAHNQRLNGPDGASLYLSRVRHQGRLEISVGYPQGSYDHRPEHFKITVKDDTPPDLIARNITRRLLPNYVTELARINAALNKGIADAGSRASTRERLTVKAVRFNGREDGSLDMSLYPTYGDVRLSNDGTQATFNRLGMVPIDVFERMLDVLRGQS
jgi:hypothetical protein